MVKREVGFYWAFRRAGRKLTVVEVTRGVDGLSYQAVGVPSLFYDDTISEFFEVMDPKIDPPKNARP